MAAGFSPAQRANTESRTTLGVVAYPPRFAAPVRPAVGTATGLMQPGWPVDTPTPSPVEPREGDGVSVQEYTTTAHVPRRFTLWPLAKQ